ncbi:uncharacterized protein [Haliotis asinina]|uniref:uncharacterized protein isoform X2 n=1 Tax=Haliotis asinina TaxID=109174 RepID=UPI0035318392
MNNRARGRGKKRKCPSNGQESKYSQVEVVTNNEEFKQTDSQSKVVPSFKKQKKVAILAGERICEQTECKVGESNYNRQEEIEGCDAPDKPLLHTEHTEETETETEAEVSHGPQETKPRARELSTEAPVSLKGELPEQEDHHPTCSLSPNTMQIETGNEPVGGTTDSPQMVESSPQTAEVTADRSDFLMPTGETCERVSDEVPVQALSDEADNLSCIPFENELKSLKQIIQISKSSETDDGNVKSMMTSEKVEDMQKRVEKEMEDTQAHVGIEKADQEPTDQGYTSEAVISSVQVQDTNQTVTMSININDSEENRRSRKHLSLNADEVISDDSVHASDRAGETNETSDPSSTDNSKTKEKEMYDSTSVGQLTDAEKNSARQLQCLSVVSREEGEVIGNDIIPLETTSGGAQKSTTAKKNSEASMLAVPGSDVDGEVDFTDSQLCEAVNMEESANQLLMLQEVRKQRMEGRRIIHDLIVDLSHLNKLVLRTKREIETARRKRQQPHSCVQNRVACQKFNEHRKF